MNYYNKYSYNPRYRVQFKDDTDVMWTVDIEQPNFTGPVMPLAPASDPLVWDGQGDESQTNCILGSTGYLRLICNERQENIFNPGNLRPTEINNRRVTVKRGNATMWIGFLTKEEYEQELKSVPYEVELPIKSVVACLEDFTLPPYEDFEEPSDTFSLLQYVVGLTGADIGNILTNVAEYEDYNGNKSGIHWTQAQVAITHWYEKDGVVLTPMSLKDVIETILYPYGHLREYGNIWGIFMATKTAGEIYEMSPDPVVSLGNRLLPTRVSIPSANLTSLMSMSTRNRSSIVDAPNKVKYERGVNSDNEIFSLDAKIIKASFTPSMSSVQQAIFDNGKYKHYLHAIEPSDINMYFAREVEYDGQFKFCRVVDADIDVNKNLQSFKDNSGLAFYFGAPGARIEYKMMNEVRSRSGYNKIKITLTEHHLDQKDPISSQNALRLSIKIKDQGKYLHGTGKWNDYEWWLDLRTDYNIIKRDGSNITIEFNEPRELDDNTPHKLKVYLKYDSGSYTNIVWCDMKMEYVKDTTYNDNKLINAFLEQTQYNTRTIINDSLGEDINIEFKTMCGQIYDVIDGAADIPFCGFKDKVGMIDLLPRKIIQLDAVRYSEASPLFLVRNYVLIQDNGTTFIPASVGCNAKECTMKLKLIQTNV